MINSILENVLLYKKKPTGFSPG